MDKQMLLNLFFAAWILGTHNEAGSPVPSLVYSSFC
jgi:hypothetical protein